MMQDLRDSEHLLVVGILEDESDHTSLTLVDDILRYVVGLTVHTTHTFSPVKVNPPQPGRRFPCAPVCKGLSQFAVLSLTTG